MQKLDKHPFNQAIKLVPSNQGLMGEMTEDYGNMIGPFGGIIAAIMLQAVIQDEACQGTPVALTVNYAKAVALGEFEVKAEATALNRSTQHWYVTMFQKGRIVITATAVFANRRETWQETIKPMPKVPEPGKVNAIPLEGLPKWLHRYEVKMIKGFPQAMLNGKDKDQGSDARTLQWIKDRPARPLDFLSLTAICDAFFPRIMLKHAEMMPLGTVSMTIYFHASQENLTACGSDYLLGEARANIFKTGFFDQSGELWSEAGQLLASTHQTVYYKI